MIHFRQANIFRATIFVACAAGMVFFSKEVTSSINLHRRTVTFVTSSGMPLESFFQGLAPNAKLREMALRPRRQGTSPCRDNSGTIRKIANTLGLGQIAHAQNPCMEGPCTCYPFAEVFSIKCTECGNPLYYYNNWYEEPTGGGWMYLDVNSCGDNPNCYCNIDSCASCG